MRNVFHVTSSQDKPLRDAVQSDPAAIDPETVEHRLAADAAADRALALQAASLLVDEQPDVATTFSDDVEALLDDDVLAVQAAAALAAMSVARERPDEIIPAVPRLVELLDEDPPLLRFRAAGALAPLTDSHPEVFSDHVDRLVRSLLDGPRFDTDLQSVAQSDDLSEEQKERRLSMLRDRTDELERGKVRSEGTREVIVNTLVEAVRVDPESCTPHRQELLTLLSDESSAVRAGAVEVVRQLADVDAETAQETVDPLLDLLDDDAEFIRARAVRALGFLEASEAVEPLSELARTEPNDELATLAEETAEWIASEDPTGSV